MVSEERALDLALAAVHAAVAAGAEWADAGVFCSQGQSVEFERNTVRECSSGRHEGLGVRAFVAGGMGTASASGLDLHTARRVGSEAAEMARTASPDPDFHRLPDPRPLEPPPVSWDDAVAGLPSQTLVEWCLEDIERGRSVTDDVFMSGAAGISAGVAAIASSTGVAVARRGTHVSWYVGASVWRDDRAASFFDGRSAVRLSDVQRGEGIVEKTVQTALALLDEATVPTGRRDVVLDYDVAGEWLYGVLAAAEAEGVQRGRSFMVGKEGDQIASDVITVIEDPFAPAAPASSSWDGEGMPKSRSALLDRGVLTTYLHNSYTAFKAGVEITGHASRSGGYVGIGLSNLQVQPGSVTKAELIAGIDSGLLIILGAPDPNRVTGQVSSTVDGGFLIEKGEVRGAVKGAMIAGHIFDLLRSVDAVSSDYRAYPGRIYPALRIRDVLVSSR
ncbi:MAG: TldD/PmbA family protein [Armatimonadetes bacterium]|nr:TldD/PmbA family protein [Armatimonadota bacterium]